jgi:hypothetical protein
MQNKYSKGGEEFISAKFLPKNSQFFYYLVPHNRNNLPYNFHLAANSKVADQPMYRFQEFQQYGKE